MSNPIAFLRLIALIEGISFLVLLGVAMPLKYFAGKPGAVFVFGWAHGVLFVVFGFALLRAMLAAKWSLGRASGVFVAGLIPFGTFVVDRRLRVWETEFRPQPR